MLSPLTVRCSPAPIVDIACPTCGGDRLAARCSGRRSLWLGPIPLIRVRAAGAHLCCSGCGHQHPETVAERLTNTILAAHLRTARWAFAVGIVGAGEPGHRELRRAAVQHLRSVDPTYDQNRLDRDLPHVDATACAELARPLRPELADEGKEQLVAELVAVALAAHTITVDQRTLVHVIGSELGLTAVHLAGIVAAVAASAEPPADRT